MFLEKSDDQEARLYTNLLVMNNKWLSRPRQPASQRTWPVNRIKDSMGSSRMLRWTFRSVRLHTVDSKWTECNIRKPTCQALFISMPGGHSHTRAKGLAWVPSVSFSYMILHIYVKSRKEKWHMPVLWRINHSFSLHPIANFSISVKKKSTPVARGALIGF